MDPIHAKLEPPTGTETYSTVMTNLGVAEDDDWTGDMVGEQADYYLYVFPMEKVSGATFTLSIYEDVGETDPVVHSTNPINSIDFLSNHIYTCNLRVLDTSLSLLLDEIEVQPITEWQAGVSGTVNW
jgi:hypothetical protein